jgi:hypothetical protein
MSEIPAKAGRVGQVDGLGAPSIDDSNAPTPGASRVHPVVKAGLDETGAEWRAPEHMLSYIWQFRSPSSIGDFGCGNANWLRYARVLGAKTVHGFDIHEARGKNLSAEEFTLVDLSEEFEMNRRFDLAISLEVGDHLPRASAPNLVRTLIAASDWVLFGAAVPFQGGAGSANENWLEFWAALFAQHGYFCYDILRIRFWHDASIPYYYRQNTCLFVKAGAEEDLTKAGLRPSKKPPTLIHPEQHLKTLAAKPLDMPVVIESIKEFYRASGVAQP